MQAKRNLAHRMGRWSGTHPWTAILGWMAFVVISFVLGSSVVTQKTLKESEQGVGESGRAAKVIDRAFPTSQTRAGEMILVQTRSGRLATADLKAVAGDVRERVGALATVTNIQAPQRSQDGRAALIRFDIRGDSEKAVDKIVPIEAAVATVAHEHPGLRVEQFGDASSGKKFDDKLKSDFQKAEFLSIPITADHPAAGLRRAAGRRHPGAARPHVGLHGLRSHRRLEPVHGHRREHADPDDADRHGSRRRLLALLPQARARGAGSRRGQARRARGRSRDQRPRRPRLGPDRHGVARRHLLPRRARERCDGDRLDPRRRRRGARLAHGAPGRARQARRPRPPQPPAAAAAAQARGARLPRLGLRPRARHAPSARLADRRRRHSRRPRPARPGHAHQADRPGRHLPQCLPGAQGLRPHPAVLPQREGRGHGRRPGT